MGRRSLVLSTLLCICCFSTVWKISEVFLEFYYGNKECSCKKCLTEEEPGEQWFKQHFQKTISPFLTVHHKLSQEAFNWWKKLQDEKSDINIFKHTTQKIFEIIPAHPPVVKPNPHHCRTCAVVGNSVNLRRSHYGKLIQLYDSIFRINLGKTEGFEEDVGNRTTHRIMYPESASKLDNNTHLVLFPFKIKDLQWLVRSFRNSEASAKQTIANKNMVMVVNPAFMQYVHKTWLQSKGKYPSTGFMTVILALHLCDEVSVFGFGADSDGNWSHYWEVLKNKRLRTGPHLGSAEYDVIVKLDREGKIVFYKGS